MSRFTNPGTGHSYEAHGGGPDEGENADCPEPDCKGVMVPQIPRWLLSDINHQFYVCDQCGCWQGDMYDVE